MRQHPHCETALTARDNGFTQDVYVAPYKGDRVCAISYTFDDGLQEHYTLLFPKLEKYGFKGTFWIFLALCHSSL